jgi:hypothetical protein
MTEPNSTTPIDEQRDAAALTFGRTVLGRDPTDVEATALREIFKATAQALQHGFIRRLADHVLQERETESVEEFFENIKAT